MRFQLEKAAHGVAIQKRNTFTVSRGCIASEFPVTPTRSAYNFASAGRIAGFSVTFTKMTTQLKRFSPRLECVLPRHRHRASVVFLSHENMHNILVSDKKFYSPTYKWMKKKTF